jgi:hypothetical protein
MRMMKGGAEGGAEEARRWWVVGWVVDRDGRTLGWLVAALDREAEFERNLR